MAENIWADEVGSGSWGAAGALPSNPSPSITLLPLPACWTPCLLLPLPLPSAAPLPHRWIHHHYLLHRHRHAQAVTFTCIHSHFPPSQVDPPPLLVHRHRHAHAVAARGLALGGALSADVPVVGHPAGGRHRYAKPVRVGAQWAAGGVFLPRVERPWAIVLGAGPCQAEPASRLPLPAAAAAAAKSSAA